MCMQTILFSGQIPVSLYKQCVVKNAESRLGHLACAGCIAKLPGGRCPGCEYGGVFEQGERALLGMMFKCHNDGCRAMRSCFLELIEHETVCPHAPKGP